MSPGPLARAPPSKSPRYYYYFIGPILLYVALALVALALVVVALERVITLALAIWPPPFQLATTSALLLATASPLSARRRLAPAPRQSQ